MLIADFLSESDLKLYHGTNKTFTTFLPFSHFGSQAQAQMRNSKLVIPVTVRNQKFKRMKDTGDWQTAKLSRMRALQRQGYDGIVYLNRYEGIPREEFEAAYAKVHDELDRLSDKQFLKLVPSAHDSYIIFDPRNVRID